MNFFLNFFYRMIVVYNKQLIFSILFLLICCFPILSNAEVLVLSAPIREMEFIDRIDLEEVVFEDGCGIEEIPDYAFLGCGSLRKVSLPSGLKKIGFQAFSECFSLEEIDFPDTLEDIGSNSFTYCRSLRDVVFPESLLHIGHNAFSFCDSLTEIVIPDGVREVESYAFSDCGSLRKVRLPANDGMLGELMMNCCPMLVEIVAPSEKVPVFDCDSFIFDPLDEAAYRRCVLKVPDNAKDNYNVSKSWQMFNKIVIGE